MIMRFTCDVYDKNRQKKQLLELNYQLFNINVQSCLLNFSKKAFQELPEHSYFKTAQ